MAIIWKGEKMEFKRITPDNMPPEKQTVWAYNENTHHVALAEFMHVTNEGWFWTLSNGIIYADESGRIVAETELDDNYEFTHFAILPELP
jgi:hypothetical protein